MFRFSLSTLLLFLALIGMALGWFVDHRRLVAENRMLNAEAAELMRAHYVKDPLFDVPDFFDGPEVKSAQTDWIRRNAPFTLATFEDRAAFRMELQKALAGIGGRPTGLADGTTLEETRNTLKRLGFEIDEEIDERGFLHARKRLAMGGYHNVNMQVEEGIVVSVFEMCED